MEAACGFCGGAAGAAGDGDGDGDGDGGRVSNVGR